MSITIEKAKVEDAAKILEYLKQVGSETDNLTFGAEGVPFTVEEEADYICQLENSCDDIMLIAKDVDKIIGTAGLNRLPRRMQHRGDFSVTVLKAYWNKGIGSQLMKEILKFAKENNFEVIDLQVRSDNTAAIHLYEKFGFLKLGTHPAFFNIDGVEISFDYMYLKV